MSEDTISRKAAVNALWKALYEYENKTEKQFLESEDLDIYDWMVHRIFVQNMSDIDRRTILDLPSAERQKVQSNECEYWDDESNFCTLNRPSAERRGRWKPFDLTWGRSIYACTACGDAFEVPTECGKPMYKFCPYCGAKMDLENEE